MDEENKLVAEKLNEGTYFSDALNWYATRYTFVQTQFSQLLIVALMGIIGLVLTVMGFYSFLPVVEKKLFVVYSPFTVEDHLSVNQLMLPGEDPDHALTQYFVQEYVKSREEYIVERSERDFNFVSHMSEQGTLQDYLSSISPDNPYSPFIVFASHGRRNIILNSMQFYDDKGNVTRKYTPKGKAVVNYTAIENFGSDASKSADYTANLEFDYTKVLVDQKTDQLTRKPEMVITNYSTKLNSGAN